MRLESNTMVDLTDTPNNVLDSEEEPPDFDDWDTPEKVFKGGSTKERMLDVVVQLREPEKVSRVADRADCDTETARDYLEWFASMGMVREVSGRPVRYARNESYLQWRRVEQIREQYTETEIVEALTETLEAVEQYRERFDADSPSNVSLVDASREVAVEEAWSALSEWMTLERRASLLDAARQDESVSGGSVERVDV